MSVFVCVRVCVCVCVCMCETPAILCKKDVGVVLTNFCISRLYSGMLFFRHIMQLSVESKVAEYFCHMDEINTFCSIFYIVEY